MKPRVIVPYVNLHPVTRQTLESYGLAPTLVRLEGDDDYRQLLHALWQAGETVVLVEQDIVPWPGAIEELVACPGEWCAHSYRLHGGIGIFHGFGCAKLSDRLMERLPDLWDEPGRWDTLDQRLWFAAREVGQEPHPHRPPVIHLNPRELAA